MIKIKVKFSKSNKPNKKYKVKIFNQTIHFGDERYQDYTIHEDRKRKLLYLARHRHNEDWSSTGIKTAGFWSRWILWNKPSLRESLIDTAKRFNITFE